MSERRTYTLCAGGTSRQIETDDIAAFLKESRRDGWNAIDRVIDNYTGLEVPLEPPAETPGE